MIGVCVVCHKTELEEDDDLGVCGSCSWRIAQRYRERILSEERDHYRARVLKLREECERQRAWTAANVDAMFAAYEQPKGTSWVYYARIGDHIKIGYTTTVLTRMRVLRVPVDDLLAIEPGAREEERARHLEFDHLRITRRWENFRPEPDLMAHIEDLHSRHGLPAWLHPPRRGRNGPITIRQVG